MPRRWKAHRSFLLRAALRSTPVSPNIPRHPPHHLQVPSLAQSLLYHQLPSLQPPSFGPRILCIGHPQHSEMIPCKKVLALNMFAGKSTLSIPFSCAIVTSDAKRVLFKRHGREPAAAQLLDQALSFNSMSRPLNAQLSRKATEGSMRSSSSGGACSFLAALLGPELEAVALSTARVERFWKGAISVEYPEEDEGPQSHRSSVPHANAVTICGTHPGSSLPKPLPGIRPAADNVHCEDLPDIVALRMGAEGSTAEGTEADEGAASACAPTAEAQQIAARSWGTEVQDGPAGGACTQDHSSASPNRTAHTASTVGMGGEDSVTAGPPLNPAAGVGPAAVAGAQVRLQKHDAAQEAAAAVQGAAAAAAAAASGSVATGAGKATGPPVFRWRKHPHRAASSPDISANMTTSAEQALGDAEFGASELWSRQKPSTFKCKSVRWSVSGESQATTPSYPHFRFCDSRPCISNGSEQSRPSPPARHSATEGKAGWPRPSAITSSLRMPCPPGRSSASTHSKEDEGGGSLRNGDACDTTQLDVTASPEIIKPSLRRSKSLSGANPRAHSRRSSLLMSNEAIERFKNGNDEAKTRTVALLRSLSQQVNFAEKMSLASAHTGAGSLQPVLSLPGTSDVQEQEEVHLHQEAPHTPSGPKSSASDASVGESTQLVEKSCAHSLSFDVTVSMLWPHMGNRSPQLVVICNTSDHWQVRTTLTTLAELQLELLSSLMPQHAIEFLATESSEAIPEHVGQLARAHRGVTLLFMDIVGFTSMSKNVKPVDVMVFLNTLFSLFDRLTDVHGVHKVETAGDCYIVSAGIMSPATSNNGFGVVVEDQNPEQSAARVMEFAKAMLEAAKQVNMPDTHEPVRVRVGLHTGDVVSGLIGSKLPKFSIFGDAMNTASRMESTGVPGRIHVSETTQKLLSTTECWESTGGVEVKGKGLMQTYLWVPPRIGAVSPPVSSLKPTSTEAVPCLLLKHTHQLLRQLNNAHGAHSAPALSQKPFVPQPKHHSIGMGEDGKQGWEQEGHMHLPQQQLGGPASLQ
ncbi:hypothetical protein DUNSADRAFT_3656 [Dunaliella salina]|uniref:Guanylate cyclase domain-containing protein n=1 Tax=Dunaliella salina TaxID=3046 RepID=A0ABQ7GTK5_DUNSA|nr:hypothetical protein DUNSADRAFT_3656 [Dunaliella salina]|eukprot:KAF5837935.1 hypothetical protein DUNSADRAFT_3656 [Dunaliella salina]